MGRIKKIFVVIHIVGWTLLSIFVFWINSVIEPETKVSVSLGMLSMGLYAFYGHFFIITYLQNFKKLATYILCLLGLLLSAPLFFVVFQAQGIDIRVASYAPSMIIVLLMCGASWLLRIIEDWFLNSLKTEQLENQVVRAELDFLKSQINSHFLFNTLNNIHALAYKKDDLAPDAILRLASLMRYMIYESNTPLVPLQLEITYLQDYICLQELRYKEECLKRRSLGHSLR
ncbi:sensor histidine kinase [Litoribacter populi]|uniref:sensor histidine kinase n=1 Tax=Litoribacter populi TaxID=2598460 RepID=UPI00117EB2D8|nr:histidine kinase [Litoribacter populi]